MAKFDASFAGLTILDIAGRPVDAIPEGGGVAFIDEIRMNPAGTASGALINAAKLGLHCTTSACVGEDEKGAFITDSYKRLNIDCSLIQTTKDSQTSSTILPIRPNGERPALHCRGASDHWYIEDDEFDQVCDARFLHHGGTGLLNAMDSGQSSKLLKHAKAKNLTTTFDLIAPTVHTIELLEDMLPYVDFFMPSLEEAQFISGMQQPRQIANFFKKMGATACVFKCGADGSYISTADRDFSLPALKIEVSDTTGCGDSYCGGFIAGLSMGHSLEEACQLGTTTAALVATGLGSDAGVIDLQSTLDFMASAETV